MNRVSTRFKRQLICFSKPYCSLIPLISLISPIPITPYPQRGPRVPQSPVPNPQSPVPTPPPWESVP